MIHRKNITLDVLKKAASFTAYGILTLLLCCIFWLKFEPGAEGYDLVIRSRLVQGWPRIGVYHKQSKEIWKIKNNDDGSSITERLYPR